ncbi:hypothetical protein [Crateriforma spongiae]|uniref:hypothetical protein n=1 Tax=Crateriforma spongiae TaxID=2724528 RepID=UPI0014454897|nr:hypothetical protein [Crateriforma spongiae]
MTAAHHDATFSGEAIADALADRLAWRLHPASAGESQERAAGDLAQRVQAALSEPIDFPAISQAMIPGDRVTLTVEAMVPELVDTVGTVVQWLANHDVGGIDVVVSDDASDELMMDLAQRLGAAAKATRHQSDRRDSLMYLVADAGAEPVYVNRQLADADFVLPIRCRRSAIAGQSVGPDQSDPAGVYPVFSDSASLQRFTRQPNDDAGFRQNLSMTIGIQAAMWVEPTIDGQANRITCQIVSDAEHHNDPTEISKGVSPDQCRANAVVVIIDGDPHQQTWMNVARAAVAGARHLNEDGLLVIWSQLQKDPPERLGAILQRFVDSGVLELPSRSDPVESDDGFPVVSPAEPLAKAFAQVMQDARVVLHSHLADEVVEDLGWGTVGSVKQLVRLLESQKEVGLIRAAQFLGPELPETVADPNHIRPVDDTEQQSSIDRQDDTDSQDDGSESPL